MSIQLSWTDPFDGYSTISRIDIYKGLVPGEETFFVSVDPGIEEYLDIATSSGIYYSYYAVAINANGSGPVGNRIFISQNKTWVRLIKHGNRNWKDFAISSNGLHCYAITELSPSDYFIYSNDGRTFLHKMIVIGSTEMTGLECIACSNDGKYVAIGRKNVTTDYLLYSSDYGSTFVSIPITSGSTIEGIISLSISMNGQMISVVHQEHSGGGYSYIAMTQDAGATWFVPGGSFGHDSGIYYSNITCSNDGKHILFWDKDRMYISHDYGDNFTDWDVPLEAYELGYSIKKVGISDNGMTVIFTSYKNPNSSGKLFRSLDGCALWTNISPVFPADDSYYGCNLDATGQKISLWTIKSNGEDSVSKIYYTSNGGILWELSLGGTPETLWFQMRNLAMSRTGGMMYTGYDYDDSSFILNGQTELPVPPDAAISAATFPEYDHMFISGDFSYYGAPKTGYKFYKSVTPDDETFLTSSVNNYTWDYDILYDIVYYYKVSATNDGGESPLSPECSGPSPKTWIQSYNSSLGTKSTSQGFVDGGGGGGGGDNLDYMTLIPPIVMRRDVPAVPSADIGGNGPYLEAMNGITIGLHFIMNINTWIEMNNMRIKYEGFGFTNQGGGSEDTVLYVLGDGLPHTIHIRIDGLYALGVGFVSRLRLIFDNGPSFDSNNWPGHHMFSQYGYGGPSPFYIGTYCDTPGRIRDFYSFAYYNQSMSQSEMRYIN